MQKIYNKEILIFAPSKGRASTCSTHNVLPSVVYVISEDEFEEYKKFVPEKNLLCVKRNIQEKPVGKVRTLNYLLDNYKTNDNIILFTDDDIKKIYRADFLKKWELKPTNEDEIKILLAKLSLIAKGIGAKIGGFACLSGGGDLMQMGGPYGYKLIEKAYIDGKAFIIYEDDGTRFDETLYLKEDIDFNCQSLLKNKRTLSPRFICFCGQALTNKGGCVDIRTTEKELEQGSLMLKKYGDMLVLRKSSRGNGVRKNAIQFGIK